MPALTDPIRLVCSFLQFSTLVFKSPSISHKHQFMDYKLSKGTILTIISIVTATELLYFVLVIFRLLGFSSSGSFRSKIHNSYVLSWLRLMLSKVFFLPIFQLLSFTISCHYFADLKAMKCSFKKDLGCLFTPGAQLDSFESHLIVLSTFTLVWHTLAGVFSELFNFSIKAPSRFGNPR